MVPTATHVDTRESEPLSAVTQTLLRTLGVFAIRIAAVAIRAGMGIIRVHSPVISWMERRGTDTAWVFRLGTLAVGGALLFLTPRADD